MTLVPSAAAERQRGSRFSSSNQVAAPGVTSARAACQRPYSGAARSGSVTALLVWLEAAGPATPVVNTVPDVDTSAASTPSGVSTPAVVTTLRRAPAPAAATASGGMAAAVAIAGAAC